MTDQNNTPEKAATSRNRRIRSAITPSAPYHGEHFRLALLGCAAVVQVKRGRSWLDYRMTCCNVHSDIARQWGTSGDIDPSVIALATGGEGDYLPTDNEDIVQLRDAVIAGSSSVPQYLGSATLREALNDGLKTVGDLQAEIHGLNHCVSDLRNDLRKADLQIEALRSALADRQAAWAGEMAMDFPFNGIPMA